MAAFDHYLYAAAALIGTFIAAAAVLWALGQTRLQARLGHFAGVVPPFINVLGVLFGLTLAFLANDTWNAHDRALAAAGLLINWRATVVVLIVPLLVIRFLMMAGNWGQHAFVDAQAPDNCYRNSITCINSSYNRRAFNDGYHIGHHLSATRHWTEMPADLLATRQQYIAERAIVFTKVDFFLVWLFLMLKRYDWLARCFVSLDGQERPRQEIIDLLRSRTQRIPSGALP